MCVLQGTWPPHPLSLSPEYRGEEKKKAQPARNLCTGNGTSACKRKSRLNDISAYVSSRLRVGLTIRKSHLNEISAYVSSRLRVGLTIRKSRLNDISAYVSSRL